ncbi:MULTISPECIES: SDR family NAD(P)-dependent oxidoreductase [Novosphingobium]|uniref:SDR family NAD(P)-dependent oxidoreductase n=1 Tax=Novosphingobium TaxID=165696 RepID=UPI001CD52A59|nr:SDR family NAD(P)-dependent oxidoreductase [Novosphingobium percolationis]
MQDKDPARSVAGLTAIVTGAGSGMGRATAEVFARDGANVALCDINGEAVEKVAAAIRAAGGSAQAWPLDITDRGALEAFVADVAARFGGIDVVVNNAGIASATPLEDPNYDAVWDRTIAVLLTSHQRMIRAALPWLRKSKSPRIVNIASTEALGATLHQSAYSAAKAGVTGLTRSLAVEFGKEGITVNCICPGPILTGMTAAISDEHKELYAKRRTALRRYGAPEEVAHMTLSLCLPAASFLTGATIPVDGGLMARNA